VQFARKTCRFRRRGFARQVRAWQSEGGSWSITVEKETSWNGGGVSHCGGSLGYGTKDLGGARCPHSYYLNDATSGVRAL